MKAAFRIDVGKEIGLGHLRRSTALAYELKKRGLSVDIFVPHNGLPAELARELTRDFSLSEFKNDDDFDMFKGYDYLISDSYKITTRQLEKLHKKVNCLIAIDDSNRIAFPVDYFINSTLYANELNYNFTESTKPLLGTKYFLLRKGLRRRKVRFPRDVRKIFLSFGASNSGKVKKMIFKIVVELEKIISDKMEVAVIVGPFFKKENKWFSKKIIFYRHPPFINSLMSSSDIAISAGGQTLYELAFLGVPIIGVCLADDHEKNLEAFSKGGHCLYVGWAESKAMISRFRENLNAFLSDRRLRENMSRSQLSLIDGYGPKRVVDEILSK